MAISLMSPAATASASPAANGGHGGHGGQAPGGITSDRVDALIAQMTLDEKLLLVSGGPENSAGGYDEYSAGYLRGVPRLGIPGLRLADGPPGVATKRLSTA
jgi:beta-glucosidase